MKRVECGILALQQSMYMICAENYDAVRKTPLKVVTAETFTLLIQELLMIFEKM